jgi:2,3-bisphosphoglycerate-independent phosphoglycerate mutase
MIPSPSPRPRPICLIILDGFGVAEPGRHNAISLADTPNYNSYVENYAHTTLGAAGGDVGLPDGQMGNSEVGHLNIGAGRIVYQELTRITRSIEDGSFFDNEVLGGALDQAKKPGQALHLLGLLSDGGVHSHNTHLYALLELAERRGLENVFVHCFLDGRDTPPQSALVYIRELEAKMAAIGVGRIATVTGRYWAMDRDNRWDRTQLAYDALVKGIAERAPSGVEAVERSYEQGIDDEFVKPTIIDPGEPAPGHGLIHGGDSVVFFNFRADRARQLTQALTNPTFAGFDRGPNPPVTHLVSLTLYDITFNLPTAFPPAKLTNTLAQTLAVNGFKQLHIAETEKYAHVTFFFNGGIETPVPGEDRVLVPSPKVATYDSQPEMNALEVAEKVVDSVESDKYDFIVVNFANPDMVGHTGKIDAAVKAIEAIDQAMGMVVRAVRARGGTALVTADHGNAEQMEAGDGRPMTAHTTNRVPLVYLSETAGDLRPGGRLADIAPTILELLGVGVPAEMTGESLLLRPPEPTARGHDT